MAIAAVVVPVMFLEVFKNFVHKLQNRSGSTICSFLYDSSDSEKTGH